MTLSKVIQDFLLNDAMERFLRYVKVGTNSDLNSESCPSTKSQLEFGKLLVEDLKELKLENIKQDEHGYVYASLPASEGLENAQAIGFIAHLDTSQDASDENIQPVIHKN